MVKQKTNGTDIEQAVELMSETLQLYAHFPMMSASQPIETTTYVAFVGQLREQFKTQFIDLRQQPGFSIICNSVCSKCGQCCCLFADGTIDLIQELSAPFLA